MTTQVGCKSNYCENDISYAASMFSKLNDDTQKAIINLMKSFVLSNQREAMRTVENKSIREEI